MNWGKYRPQKFLKQEHVVPPTIMRIVGCGDGNVARRSEPEEFKSFVDLENDAGEKFRRTCNGQNVEKIVELYGEDGADCIGRDIGVTWNPEVEYDGRKTGGIEFVAPEEIEPVLAEPARGKPTLRLKRTIHEEPLPTLRRKEPQSANNEENAVPY